MCPLSPLATRPMLAGGASGPLPGSVTDSTVTVPSLAPTNRAHVSSLDTTGAGDAADADAGPVPDGVALCARLERRSARSAATDDVPSLATTPVDRTAAALCLVALSNINPISNHTIAQSQWRRTAHRKCSQLEIGPETEMRNKRYPLAPRGFPGASAVVIFRRDTLMGACVDVPAPNTTPPPPAGRVEGVGASREPAGTVAVPVAFAEVVLDASVDTTWCGDTVHAVGMAPGSKYAYTNTTVNTGSFTTSCPNQPFPDERALGHLVSRTAGTLGVENSMRISQTISYVPAGSTLAMYSTGAKPEVRGGAHSRRPEPTSSKSYRLMRMEPS